MATLQNSSRQPVSSGPALIADVRHNERHVLGRRDAADAAGLPVGRTGYDLDVYLRAADLDELTDAHLVRFDATKPNLHRHIVPARASPFTVNQRFTPLLVDWLELGDRNDRAAPLVRRTIPPEPVMSDIPTIDLRAELLDRHAGAIKGALGK